MGAIAPYEISCSKLCNIEAVVGLREVKIRRFSKTLYNVITYIYDLYHIFALNKIKLVI